MPQPHSLRPLLALAIFLAALSAPLRGEAGENDCGTLPDTTGAGSSRGAGSSAWVRPAAIDTVGMLIVFAKFPDGDDLTHCDTTSAGWPDGDAIPTWADSLIEDAFSPAIEGSISHFYSEMSQGQHIVKGSVYPNVITVNHTIGYYDSLFQSTPPDPFGDGIMQVRAANRDVVNQVINDLTTDALDYDLNGDGFVDEIFIYYRSPRATYGGSITNFKFGGESTLLESDSTFVFGSESVSVGGGLNNGGGSLFWKVYEGSRVVDRWQVLGVLAHEYGHDLPGTYHLPSVGPYGIMGGTLPASELGPDGIMSAHNRHQLGWIDPPAIDSTMVNPDDPEITVTIRNAATEGSDGYLIVRTHIAWPYWEACGTPDERLVTSTQYFMLECRSASGSPYLGPRGSGPCAIPEGADGLLVTHFVENPGSGVPIPFMDLELAGGRFASDGSIDPVWGEDELGANPFGTPDDTWGSSPTDLFQPGSGDEGWSNAFTPFTNPNTNLHRDSTIVNFFTCPPGTFQAPVTGQTIYSGISIYNIQWANPGKDSMYVTIRFDGSAPPTGADSIQTDMTLDGRVQLSGDVVVKRGKKLTLTDNARIYSEASGDRLATGKDTTLVEMAVLGLIEANGAVFSSSRDPAFDHYLDDQQPAAGEGDHYGLRFDNLVATRAGYGYTGVEGAMSEIRDTEFRYGEVGIAIEGQAAPSLSGLSFSSIVGDRHILLDSTDVILPYAVQYDSCWAPHPDSCVTLWRVDPTVWDLEGGTHVVARNGMRSGQDSNVGVTGKDDLIVGGKLFASGSTASGDTVYFRPEFETGGADDWGGITIDQGNAKGGTIEYADISHAENPLFVFYPDSLWALRHSRIHDFAEVGIWVDGASGQGGVIESNTIERGTSLDEELGRTGIFVDGADALRVSDNKIDLSGLDIGLTSAALDLRIGKFKCVAPPSATHHLKVEGNWIIGPGTSGIAGAHSAIRSTWLCGSATRDIDIVRNYAESFNHAGLYFLQTEAVQADSNNVVESLRGIDISRLYDPALTQPVAGFKANWWEVLDEERGVEAVRTNSIEYTAFGPSSSTLGDNGFMVADSAVVFMNETDSAVDTLVAEDCYWYLDEGGSEPHFLNTMQEWSVQILKRLDPDSTKYDVWPLRTSDTNPAYYRLTGPPSVGRALAGRGEAVGPDVRRGGEDAAAEAARLARVVPSETYFNAPLKNPVRTEAVLELGVAQGMEGRYQIEVFSVTGRKVAVLHSDNLPPGTYRITWSGTDASAARVSAGVYFIRAQGPGFQRTQKVTLLR